MKKPRFPLQKRGFGALELWERTNARTQRKRRMYRYCQPPAHSPKRLGPPSMRTPPVDSLSKRAVGRGECSQHHGGIGGGRFLGD